MVLDLIIGSPPARGAAGARRAGRTDAHMWRARRPNVFAARAACFVFIFKVVVTRGGSRCCLHKPEQRLQPRRMHGAHSGNRSDGRGPTVLFRENTNLEWMVLAIHERTPSVESIFRADLRVRTERAGGQCCASGQHAASLTAPKRRRPSQLALAAAACGSRPQPSRNKSRGRQPTLLKTQPSASSVLPYFP